VRILFLLIYLSLFYLRLKEIKLEVIFNLKNLLCIASSWIDTLVTQKSIDHMTVYNKTVEFW